MAFDNGALIRRWFEEVWNERREATIEEFLTPESVCYSDDGPIVGPEAFKSRQYVPFLAAFSDLKLQVEGVVVEGDVVVARWSASGTHDGDGLGFRATHESTSFYGMTWVEFRDGKFARGWQNSNIPDVIGRLSARAPA
jgi:predicted ester cyclase